MINTGDAMKALAEKNASDGQSNKINRKRPSTELPESVLRRIRDTLANPVAEEPAGVLAGDSFKFSS
jgi:hypothetical protein